MNELDAQNHLYDGWLYQRLIDPALSGIRRRIKKLVPPDARVLDVGCGTGDQLVHLADKLSYGLGIELSEAMARTASRRLGRLNIEHCEVQLADASKLENLTTASFDIATCSMMIHEMPESKRLPVLNEMTRLGKRIILVDWIYPPAALAKRWSTHIIEFMAGREHYAGYRSFMANGGIPALLKATELNVIETQITSKGTIQLWVCEIA